MKHDQNHKTAKSTISKSQRKVKAEKLWPTHLFLWMSVNMFFVLHWFLNSVFLVKKKNKYCDSTTIPITKVTSVKNNPNMIFFFCSAPNERHNEPFVGIPSLQIFWKRSGSRYHANTICSFMCRFLFFFYKRKKENELHGASFSGRAPTGPLFLSKASAKTNSAQRALLEN